MKAIAIDGPGGAGKSTLARKLAEELRFIYIDTGALYRAIGYFVLQQGGDLRDETAVKEIIADLDVDLRFVDGNQHVLVNGTDVTGKIRTEAVSVAAAAIGALPSVRAFLLDLQRGLARDHNVVMDGRDIGTVVLPHADVKIFLTAAPEERARRRHKELLQKGQKADYCTVLSDLRRRDYDDSHREISPLKPAEDAVLVDTTGNTLERSVQVLTSIVKEHLG